MTTKTKQQNKILKLRFPEFSGKWEEKRLGKIADFWNGKAHEQDISDNGKYIVVNSKFISSNGEVKKYSDFQISPLKKGDIVIVMSDVPNGRAIAKCFLVDKDDRYTLNQRIGGVRSEVVISPFLFRILNRNRYFLRFDNGVSQTNLRKDEILRCPVIFPNIPEQQKIAGFLGVVDERIEVLKKKREGLEKYKKGIMQKIFPAKGEKVPQVRFKSDNGKNFPDWEEKELGEICNYQNGGSFEKFVVENGKYNLITLNSISIDGKLKPYHKKVNRADWYLKKNDLIMVLSDVAHGNFLGLTDIIPADNKYVLNQRMGLLRKIDYNMNLFFLKTFINNNQKYFKIRGQGSSQQNLSKGDILKFRVRFPTLPEQQKIASFLSMIDKKIELVDTQIQKMQEWKRGLMQGLFVGN